MHLNRSLILLAFVAFLSGCGANDSSEGPGGVTASEARALNEAAEMLDARTSNALAAETGSPSEDSSKTPAR